MGCLLALQRARPRVCPLVGYATHHLEKWPSGITTSASRVLHCLFVLCCQRTPFYMRDDLLLTTDTAYPPWFMLLLAGVKHRPYQDQLRFLFTSASPAAYIHFIHYCVMTSPPYHSPNPRAEVYYSTGITYFLCQQLGLYKKMTSASTPVATRACELHPGARRTLQDFMDACRDVHLDVSCVSTGRAYLVAMQMLIRLQGDAFARSGSYVAPRIARAVLWAYGPVRRWGDVTVGELQKVSADQKGFLGRCRPDMRVADLAARYDCPGELVSMCACLGLLN